MRAKEKLEDLYKEVIQNKDISTVRRFEFAIEIAVKISRIEEEEASRKREIT